MSQLQLHPALAAVLALMMSPAGLARAEPAGSSAPAASARPAAAVDEMLQNEAALRAIDEHWGAPRATAM
jgi:hypothetical protein